MVRDDLRRALDGAHVLVTGGAGFVGSHVAVSLAREVPGARVVALDNLQRRGSELKLADLAAANVTFVHGDVRIVDDLLAVNEVDLLIDCAAEPSVLAAYQSSPRRVLDGNLIGTINCLELARTRRAKFLFLSTSRVYPIAPLNEIAVAESESRFEIAEDQPVAGVSAAGVNEAFGLTGARSLYGSTKLAAELLLHEYGAMYDLPFVINRLGVITGPGQMGRVEQGVFALWVARHLFGGELSYIGWGGNGKQVRDLVHVADVWELLRLQILNWPRVNGKTYNAGGGRAVSLSLLETTRLCQQVVGTKIPIRSRAETHASDVRLYISDARAVHADLGWQPSRAAPAILEDIFQWLKHDETRLRPLFSA